MPFEPHHHRSKGRGVGLNKINKFKMSLCVVGLLRFLSLGWFYLVKKRGINTNTFRVSQVATKGRNKPRGAIIKLC